MVLFAKRMIIADAECRHDEHSNHGKHAKEIAFNGTSRSVFWWQIGF